MMLINLIFFLFLNAIYKNADFQAGAMEVRKKFLEQKNYIMLFCNFKL